MKYNDNGLWKTLNVKVTDTLPVGTIIPYAGTTIPSNYMKCEGQALSRIEYDILFSAIGTTYGEGDGSTTFNLPNLKGRVITGIDSNDTDFDTLGETGGEKTHTLTVEEIPSHNHDLNGYTDTPNQGSLYYLSVKGIDAYGVTQTENAGGGQAHNIMQPYIVLNYIIKVLDAPAIQAQVVNGYSTSSRDSYSCNYVNSINTYSTDEIRVGTWIDGKPIYRKVYIENSPTTGAWDYVDIDNNYEIKTYKGFYQRTNNRLDALSVGCEDAMPLICTIRNNQIEYKIDSTYASGKISAYFILEYIKTTD